MAKLAFALTAFFFLFALTSHAADEPEPVLSSYQLLHPTRSELDSISRFWNLEHKTAEGFELSVPREEAGLLRTLVSPARLRLVHDDEAHALEARLADYATELRAERYHSFDEVQAWMKSMQDSYALLARVVPYGTSRGGKPLKALRVSAEPEDGTLPAVMITAATHGDELITTEVVLHLVEKLLTAYENPGQENARLTQLLRNRVLWFVPVVNADGFVSRNRYDGNKDPNRSYPWPSQPNAVATPSIDALIKLFHEKNFRATLDFHAYGEMVMFPWAYTRSHIDAEPFARMDQLTRAMAERNSYAHGPIAEVIYVAQGSSADYYFWKTGATGIAIEIGSSKVPNPSQFPAIFASQEESTWRFLEGRY